MFVCVCICECICHEKKHSSVQAKQNNVRALVGPQNGSLANSTGTGCGRVKEYGKTLCECYQSPNQQTSKELNAASVRRRSASPDTRGSFLWHDENDDGLGWVMVMCDGGCDMEWVVRGAHTWKMAADRSFPVL